MSEQQYISLDAPEGVVIPHNNPEVEFEHYRAAGGEADYETWFSMRQTQRTMVSNSAGWFAETWEGQARRYELTRLECLLGY